MNCKEKVYAPGAMLRFQCQRKATRDGYCWQHHPDAVKKRREEAARRYEEEWENERKNDPVRKLACCQKQRAELEAEVERLRRWVAAQPCKFPQPVARLGNAVSDNVRDCGDCIPCQARRELKGSKT